MFVVEDEMHAEKIGEFDVRADAVAKLRKLAVIPWNQWPTSVPARVGVLVHVVIT